MGPGGGLKSPDASGMMSEIDNRQREAVGQIEAQRTETLTETKKTFQERVREYSGRKVSIGKSISEVSARLNKIPNIPQAKEVRGKLEAQLKQLRDALNHINKAMEYMKMQADYQARTITERFSQRKSEVVTTFKQQKANILLRIAAQQSAMQQRASQVAQFSKSPEGGKVKG